MLCTHHSVAQGVGDGQIRDLFGPVRRRNAQQKWHNVYF